MKLDYKLIGHRIHILRKRQKLSQAALAESTGYSVPYISHIETGIKRCVWYNMPVSKDHPKWNG